MDNKKIGKRSDEHPDQNGFYCSKGCAGVSESGDVTDRGKYCEYNDGETRYSECHASCEGSENVEECYFGCEFCNTKIRALGVPDYCMSLGAKQDYGYDIKGEECGTTELFTFDRSSHQIKDSNGWCLDFNFVNSTVYLHE